MKIRIVILAACASALALGLTATAGTCEGLEKTFFDRDNRAGKAKTGNSAGGANSNLAVPTDSRDVTRSSGGGGPDIGAFESRRDRMGGGGGGKGASGMSNRLGWGSTEPGEQSRR